MGCLVCWVAGLPKARVRRRRKSVTLRCALWAFRCKRSRALARSRCNIGPKLRNSKNRLVMTRTARKPTYSPWSFMARGCDTSIKPAALRRPMARSQRRWPMPDSRTMVLISMSIKPASRVGVPRHKEARSRCASRVSMTIWQASHLSERVCLCGWACRSLHFLGWKYHALARSAARERMRGNAPLPLARGFSGESLGALGLCPQRLPIMAVIQHPQLGRKMNHINHC